MSFSSYVVFSLEAQHSNAATRLLCVFDTRASLWCPLKKYISNATLRRHSSGDRFVLALPKHSADWFPDDRVLQDSISTNAQKWVLSSQGVAAVLRDAGLTMPMERGLRVVAQVEQYSLLIYVCTRSAAKGGTCRVSQLEIERKPQ